MPDPSSGGRKNRGKVACILRKSIHHVEERKSSVITRAHVTYLIISFGSIALISWWMLLDIFLMVKINLLRKLDFFLFWSYSYVTLLWLNLYWQLFHHCFNPQKPTFFAVRLFSMKIFKTFCKQYSPYSGNGKQHRKCCST